MPQVSNPKKCGKISQPTKCKFIEYEAQLSSDGEDYGSDTDESCEDAMDKEMENFIDDADESEHRERLPKISREEKVPCDDDYELVKEFVVKNTGQPLDKSTLGRKRVKPTSTSCVYADSDEDDIHTSDEDFISDDDEKPVASIAESCKKIRKYVSETLQPLGNVKDKTRQDKQDLKTSNPDPLISAPPGVKVSRKERTFAAMEQMIKQGSKPNLHRSGVSSTGNTGYSQPKKRMAPVFDQRSQVVPRVLPKKDKQSKYVGYVVNAKTKQVFYRDSHGNMIPRPNDL